MIVSLVMNSSCNSYINNIHTLLLPCCRAEERIQWQTRESTSHFHDLRRSHGLPRDTIFDNHASRPGIEGLYKINVARKRINEVSTLDDGDSGTIELFR